MQSRFFVFIALSACCTGCETVPPPESRYEKIAAGYCECTSALATLNRQAQALATDKSKRAELSACFQKIQTEYLQTKECAASIVAQFGRLNTGELAAVGKALAVKCPTLSEQEELLRELLGK